MFIRIIEKISKDIDTTTRCVIFYRLPSYRQVRTDSSLLNNDFASHFADNVKHVNVVLGDAAELPCDEQSVRNLTEWPILLIWYRGQDYPIYR